MGAQRHCHRSLHLPDVLSVLFRQQAGRSPSARWQDSHFCRFNNAYKINKGNHGATRLDGAKFWISGDLGGDFSHGQMDWAVVTFDKAHFVFSVPLW